MTAPGATAIREALGLDPNAAAPQISGGVDLGNADASVVTQEFSLVKG